MEDEIKRSISQGQPPSKPGEPPHVLWGRLRSSITHEVEKSGKEIIGRVGTNVEYVLAPISDPRLRRIEETSKGYSEENNG